MCISYKAIALCEMLCNAFHSNKTMCYYGVSLSIPAYTGGGGSSVGVFTEGGPLFCKSLLLSLVSQVRFI